MEKYFLGLGLSSAALQSAESALEAVELTRGTRSYLSDLHHQFRWHDQQIALAVVLQGALRERYLYFLSAAF